MFKSGVAIITLIMQFSFAVANTTPIAPLQVTNDLFDMSAPATLGLTYPKGIETSVVFKSALDRNQYNHGAVLFPYKGRLYIQWQSSARDEDANDTAIRFSTSKQGIRWQNAKTLVAARDNAIVTSGGWWSNGDTLVAFINVWPTSLTPKQGYVEFIQTDDGENWTTPKRVRDAKGEWVNGIIEQDLRRLPNGRILTVMHVQPGLIATPYYTDDPLGISGWKAAVMNNLPYTGDISRELEPSWYIDKDDRIIMVFRDQHSSFNVLAALSTDNAESWTTPVITNMPDSRAKQSAGNLPDGSAFLVNNPSGNKQRIPLAITLSEDGRLFERAFLLRAGDNDLPQQQFAGKYKRAGYSYPKSLVWNEFLYVSYAVNKEDIAVTRVPVRSLQVINQ